jgi:hypothetical protein
MLPLRYQVCECDRILITNLPMRLVDPLIQQHPATPFLYLWSAGNRGRLSLPGFMRKISNKPHQRGRRDVTDKNLFYSGTAWPLMISVFRRFVVFTRLSNIVSARARHLDAIPVSLKINTESVPGQLVPVGGDVVRYEGADAEGAFSKIGPSI